MVWSSAPIRMASISPITTARTSVCDKVEWTAGAALVMEKEELSEFKCGADHCLSRTERITTIRRGRVVRQISVVRHCPMAANADTGRRGNGASQSWWVAGGRTASLNSSAPPPRHGAGRQLGGRPAMRAKAARAPAVRRDGPVAPVAAYRGREALPAAAACRDDPAPGGSGTCVWPTGQD